MRMGKVYKTESKMSTGDLSKIESLNSRIIYFNSTEANVK
jgi:hypothetical protein